MILTSSSDICSFGAKTRLAPRARGVEGASAAKCASCEEIEENAVLGARKAFSPSKIRGLSDFRGNFRVKNFFNFFKLFLPKPLTICLRYAIINLSI